MNDQLQVKMNVMSSAITYYADSQSPSRQNLLENLDANGLALIRDVDPESPENMLRYGQRIGTTDVDIDEELLGPVVMHLRFDANRVRDDSPPSYFTSNFFPLHTDVSYVSNPPRFLLLHCIYPDPAGGGHTFLADFNKAAEIFPESVKTIISQPLFNFLYPPGCPEGESQRYAISESNLWRYKYSSMRVPQQVQGSMELINQVLTEISFPVSLERGDLLIVDNHRFAHGRSEFHHTRSSLPGRHFMRTYANPDFEK